jgi:hypothetical protein
MKKVCSVENSVELGFIKGMLEQDGIDCLVKNQNLSGALGEIPPLECWPELWVTDDRDFDVARKIVDTALAPPSNNKTPWLCDCGESIEAQFTACWSCGLEKPISTKI